MNEIVRTLDAEVELSNQLAGSSLLPREYQKNPANLLYAIQYAKALGIEPINAVTGIHVISGKPTLSAALMAAQVRKAGHKLRVTADENSATAILIRNDDPDFEFTATWTIAKANAAGVTSNATWKKFPSAMLRSRAISEVIQQGASEVLHGANYLPEELESSTPVGVPVPAGRGVAGLREALVTVTPTDGVSEVQLRRLHVLRNEKGLSREAFLAGASSALGRPVESSKTLTKDEAKHLIDRISAMPTPEPEADPVTGEM